MNSFFKIVNFYYFFIGNLLLNLRSYFLKMKLLLEINVEKIIVSSAIITVIYSIYNLFFRLINLKFGFSYLLYLFGVFILIVLFLFFIGLFRDINTNLKDESVETVNDKSINLNKKIQKIHNHLITKKWFGVYFINDFNDKVDEYQFEILNSFLRKDFEKLKSLKKQGIILKTTSRLSSAADVGRLLFQLKELKIFNEEDIKYIYSEEILFVRDSLKNYDFLNNQKLQDFKRDVLKTDKLYSNNRINLNKN